MIYWEDKPLSAGDRALSLYRCTIPRLLPFEPVRGHLNPLDLAHAVRVRFPLADASEIETAIWELWPHLPHFESVEDYLAWFSTAVEAGLVRVSAEAARRRSRAAASVRLVRGRAHVRKPGCGIGGFFSAEKVNLRNAP